MTTPIGPLRRSLAFSLAAGTLIAIAVTSPIANAAPSAFGCTLHRAAIQAPLNRPLADLYDVKVVSSHNAWAVGTYARLDAQDTPKREYPLAEHWNGTAWNAVPVPRTPHADDEDLTKLAVISTTNVWAIGNQSNWLPGYSAGPVPGELTVARTGIRSHGVVDRWNGHQWTRMVLPTFGGNASFTSISAAGPANVWIVGSWFADRHPGMHVLPLFLHWNGKVWTEQHPNLFPNYRMSATNDVQATSVNDVLAVGTFGLGGTAHGFSASLKNGAWVKSAAPILSNVSGDWGVATNERTITQGSDQFASIGANQFGSGNWSNVATVPLWKFTEDSSADVYGNDVVDAGPSDAWLVGSQMDWDTDWFHFGDVTGFGPVYAQHWDGGSWSEVTLPASGSSAPWLNAIDTSSDGRTVVMVGTIVTPDRMKSLPLIYLGNCT